MGAFQQSIRKDWRQLIDDILLAKITHMNYIRLTQCPVQPEIYEYCDRLGLMLQTDLPLFMQVPAQPVLRGRASGRGDGAARAIPSVEYHGDLHQ